MWNIVQLECFDGAAQQEILLALNDLKANHIFQEIMREFSKYDVEIKLHSPS